MLFHKSIKVLLLILLFNRSLAVSIKNAEQQEECDKPGENGASFVDLEPALKNEILNTSKAVFVIDEKLDYLTENLNRCGASPAPTTGPALKTCESLLYELPYATSGFYMIQPNDQNGPFRVYCEVTESGIYTVFPPVNTDETAVSKCGLAKCFQAQIHYKHTLRAIRAVVDVSEACRQRIKYRCKGSVLNHRGVNFASWFTYDGKEMHYWGGEGGDGHTCACGVSGACLDPSKSCNCDKNDDSLWTADEGYLTNDDQLPVSKLKFGDTDGANEAAFYQLGSLKCSGLL